MRVGGAWQNFPPAHLRKQACRAISRSLAVWIKKNLQAGWFSIWFLSCIFLFSLTFSSIYFVMLISEFDYIRAFISSLILTLSCVKFCRCLPTCTCSYACQALSRDFIRWNTLCLSFNSWGQEGGWLNHCFDNKLIKKFKLTNQCTDIAYCVCFGRWKFSYYKRISIITGRNRPIKKVWRLRSRLTARNWRFWLPKAKNIWGSVNLA